MSCYSPASAYSAYGRADANGRRYFAASRARRARAFSFLIGTVQTAGWIVEGRVVGVSDRDTLEAGSTALGRSIEEVDVKTRAA
jgi:hypothetical protein